MEDGSETTPRDERINQLWEIVDYFGYKLNGDGRIRDTATERVRVDMANAMIRALSEIEDMEENKELEELAERIEELEVLENDVEFGGVAVS